MEGLWILLGDLVKIMLPAGAVMYAMFLVMKSFVTKDFEKKLVDLKLKNNELIIPVRLQAYERMAMFLERISPHNLVIRMNDNSLSVGAFHQLLLTTVREEFNHNLSQQVYMTDQTWNLIKNAKEDVSSLINLAAQQVNKDGSSLELSKAILELLVQRNEDPVAKALKTLKMEIQQVF